MKKVQIMKFYKLPNEHIQEFVILANGSYPTHTIPLNILRNSKKIIACDGAANSLIEKGIIPYAIVGDCDSLSDYIKENYADIIYPDKDQETNDLTKAVNFCFKNDIKKIIILGATGKRDDHAIANISLLDTYAQFIDVMMVTDYACLNVINQPSTFESYKGQQVSIFCLDYKPVSVNNLLYDINNKIFNRWWQASLNESINNSFDIIVSGATIVYREF